jgi:hypothetical protein
MKRKFVFFIILLSFLSNIIPIVNLESMVKASAILTNSEAFDAIGFVRGHAEKMNDLIKREFPLAPRFSQSPDREKKPVKQTKDLINGNSVLKLDQTLKKEITDFSKTDTHRFSFSNLNVHNRGAPFPPGLIVCLFLLVFFIQLSRSDLPSEMLMSHAYATQLRFT